MRIGAHLSRTNIKQNLEQNKLNAAQIFLGSPRSWSSNITLSKSEEEYFNATDTPIFVHAPYLINPPSINPEVRKKSLNSLQKQLDNASLINSAGVVVHSGQAGKDGDMKKALEYWKECFDSLDYSTPLVLENTAGGNTAPGRHLEDYARLLELAKDYPVEYCVDTCHSWAGGFGLESLYERLLEAVGRPPVVVHMNGSADGENSGRDHHSNFVEGGVMTELAIEFARECDVTLVLETPGGGFSSDVELLKRRLGIVV